MSPAYAQFSNVPPMVVENYVGGVLLPAVIIAFCSGIIVGILITLIARLALR